MYVKTTWYALVSLILQHSRFRPAIILSHARAPLLAASFCARTRREEARGEGSLPPDILFITTYKWRNTYAVSVEPADVRKMTGSVLIADRRLILICVYVGVFFLAPSYVLSSPFLFLSLSVVTQIRDHIAGSSPAPPHHGCALYCCR